MIIEILQKTFVEFIKILPILLLAILVSQVVKVYFHARKMKKLFKESKKNIVKSSLVGICTPGPLLAFLPLLRELKNKKVGLSLLVAFMTGQTLIGPARLFLEVGYFGWEFFLVRLVISFFIAIGVGMVFLLLEKHIKFKP